MPPTLKTTQLEKYGGTYMPIFDNHQQPIYYEITGSGEPVVLITGLGGNHGNWRPYVQRLQQEFCCITLDNRGTGKSFRPREPYSIRDMAEDVSRLIDHLGFDRVHVIGNSLGGRIAQQLAVNEPFRVKSLILMSTTAKLSPWYDAILASWVRMRTHMSLEDYYRSVAPWICGPSSYAQQSYIDGFVRYSVANDTQDLQDFLLQVQAIREHDTEAQLQDLTMDCLLIAGREDLPLIQDMMEMETQIPNATLRIIERTGHMAAFEKFTEVFPIVREFLLAHTNTE
jgi:3-oxoadipate enol-lactonase